MHYLSALMDSSYLFSPFSLAVFLFCQMLRKTTHLAPHFPPPLGRYFFLKTLRHLSLAPSLLVSRDNSHVAHPPTLPNQVAKPRNYLSVRMASFHVNPRHLKIIHLILPVFRSIPQLWVLLPVAWGQSQLSTKETFAWILVRLYFTALSPKVTSSCPFTFLSTRRDTFTIDVLPALRSPFEHRAVRVCHCTLLSYSRTPSLHWPIASNFFLLGNM